MDLGVEAEVADRPKGRLPLLVGNTVPMEKCWPLQPLLPRNSD
jgi:hypothetical protein